MGLIGLVTLNNIFRSTTRPKKKIIKSKKTKRRK